MWTIYKYTFLKSIGWCEESRNLNLNPMIWLRYEFLSTSGWSTSDHTGQTYFYRLIDISICWPIAIKKTMFPNGPKLTAITFCDLKETSRTAPTGQPTIYIYLPTNQPTIQTYQHQHGSITSVDSTMWYFSANVANYGTKI